jgi:hypothetical protein
VRELTATEQNLWVTDHQVNLEQVNGYTAILKTQDVIADFQDSNRFEDNVGSTIVQKLAVGSTTVWNKECRINGQNNNCVCKS